MVYIILIYILGDFGGIWSSYKGGSKLEGLTSSKAWCNSSSWRGFVEHYQGLLIFSLSLLVGGLWRLGYILKQPLGGTYVYISYYCIELTTHFDIIGAFFQIYISLVYRISLLSK
jgi:hypothetical protein